MTNMKTVSIALDALLLITLTNFIRFHIGLVKDNFTTIENLEREEGVKSKWDIGVNRNCEQVFGPNPWLYAVPFHLPASRPVGRGFLFFFVCCFQMCVCVCVCGNFMLKCV